MSNENNSSAMGSELAAVKRIEEILRNQGNERQAPTEQTEEAPEQVAENDSPEIRETEEQPKPKYKVKANGEELEVDLDELLQGYQRQADYTRKTMELAEERKKASTITQELENIQRVRSEYEKNLAAMTEVLESGKVSDQKLLNILQEEGEEAYLKAKIQQEQIRQHLDTVKREKQRVEAESKTQAFRQWEERRNESLKAIAEFNDQNFYQKAQSFVKELGLDPRLVDSLSEPGEFKILKMAIQAAEVEKAKQTVATKQKANNPTNVLQQGERMTREELGKEEALKLRSLAKKTGKIEDAAKYIATLL